MTAKELKELSGIEAAIRAAEARAGQAAAALEDPAVARDCVELGKRQSVLDDAKRSADTLLARWEELEARKA